jgi:hypothetical protein
MNNAITFVEQSTKFVTLLLNQNTHEVQRVEGRRYDRYSVDNKVKYFVDRQDWTIYGAKSHFQHNPRREFGTLLTIDQYNWPEGTTIPGTDAHTAHEAREATIRKAYKKRGRPKKVVAP